MLDDERWTDCQAEWRAPFLPAATGGWATYTALDDLFLYNGSGVMPGRTWVIAPDRQSLETRWNKLIAEPDAAKKEALFHPHLRNGDLGDKYAGKVVAEGLYGHEHRSVSVANDKGELVAPMRYGFRFLDRQWIIPDNRLLNQPNPTLWNTHSIRQVYMTALMQHSPTSGPATTFTGLIPDLHHYKGSFGGRAFPLWSDAAGTQSNLQSGFLAKLGETYGEPVSGEDVFAYIAAIASHPAYTTRFAPHLVQPGLRIPITADAALFAEAAELGREVVWLQTFGERFTAPKDGRPASPPRLPTNERPTVPKGGGIPSEADAMPNAISYDSTARCLHVGSGHVDNVAPEVWAYEISGKHVLTHWFSYRGRDRSRPIIGDRRPPSPLGNIQTDGWPSEYTTELLNVLNILGRLVALEPRQEDLLKRICAGSTISGNDVNAAILAVLPTVPPHKKAKLHNQKQGELLA